MTLRGSWWKESRPRRRVRGNPLLSGRAKRASQVPSRRKRQPRSARGKTSRTAGVPEKPRPFVVRRYRGDDTVGVSEAAARLRVSRTTVHDGVAEKVLLARRSTKRGPEHSCGADPRTRPGGGGSRRSCRVRRGSRAGLGVFRPGVAVRGHSCASARITGGGTHGRGGRCRARVRRQLLLSGAGYPRKRLAPVLPEERMPDSCRIIPRQVRATPPGNRPADSRICSRSAGYRVLLHASPGFATAFIPSETLTPEMGLSGGCGYLAALCLTPGSSQHCCSRGVGPVRNRKVAPGSTSSSVSATGVPGWSVTERKLSAGGHLGEVHVETRPVTLASRCPGLTEWSAAGSTFPRRHTASSVTVEKTCSCGSNRDRATAPALPHGRPRAGRLSGKVYMAIIAR